MYGKSLPKLTRLFSVFKIPVVMQAFNNFLTASSYFVVGGNAKRFMTSTTLLLFSARTKSIISAERLWTMFVTLGSFATRSPLPLFLEIVRREGSESELRLGIYSSIAEKVGGAVCRSKLCSTSILLLLFLLLSFPGSAAENFCSFLLKISMGSFFDFYGTDECAVFYGITELSADFNTNRRCKDRR